MVIVALLAGVALGALLAWLVLRERLRVSGRANEELSNAFKALAAEALRSNSTSFLELARTQLETFQVQARDDLTRRQQAVEQLVVPIREALDKVGSEVKTLEQARREAYGRLTEQVRSLGESQERLRAETGSLVTALRAPSVRGRWGEMQLRRAVEATGMLAYCDFVEQTTVSADERQLRPDLVVRLPGGKHVVVDAKVPLQALLDAREADDEAAYAARMHDYVRHVRDHMAKLSAKGYWQQFSPAPDFVVMYLPGESFFRAALEHDPSLLEQGPSQRVILASPTTLITLLRAVAVGWREETVAESARAVSELGRELYDRLVTLAEHFARLGRGLDGAVTAYNEAVGSLERRVLVSARRFPELGVPARGELPEVAPIEQLSRSLAAPELTEAIERRDEADAA